MLLRLVSNLFALANFSNMAAEELVYNTATGVNTEELLSETVRTYPILYDKTLKEFKDKNAKQNAWKAVAESVPGIQTGRYSMSTVLLLVPGSINI